MFWYLDSIENEQEITYFEFLHLVKRGASTLQTPEVLKVG